MGISLAWEDGNGLNALYVPFNHIFGPNYDLERFRLVIQAILDTKPIIFHNSKFDLASLRTLGLFTEHVNFFDTMLIAHQIREYGYNQGLDSCAKFYLDDPGKKMKGSLLEQMIKIVGWAGVPSEMMVEYAAYDAHLTYRLFKHLWPLYVADGASHHWKHRSKVVRLIGNMERNGVRVDVPLCEAMATRGHAEMSRLRALLGGLNPSSVNDLPVLLIDRLGLEEIKSPKTGRRTFDKDAMEIYEDILAARGDKTAQQILAYRGWQKATSANYEAYVNLISPDGRLRPGYKLHGTKTGRLSCAKPNLQQIPRSGVKPWNGRMKACFIPQDGYVLIEADYSQLEFRLTAAYAKEQDLLEAFADPTRDVFTEMAEELGQPRQETKTQVYATGYGAGAKRISQALGISLAEAKRRIDQYNARYPGIKRISNLYGYMAENDGEVKMWSGRKRHFQWPKDEAHKAFNAVIQGGAADIVEATMLRCERAGLNNGTDSRMLLQIHDAIVFEVREEVVYEAATAINDCMVNVEPDFGVKFKVDMHYWGTKEPVPTLGYKQKELV